MSVFADTSALYALLDRDDQFHAAARDAWAGLLSQAEPLLTSNYVLVESFALVQGRLGVEALRTLTDDLLPVVAVQWVSEDDHRIAVGGVLAAGRRTLSLVDCASFAVMRRQHLRRAFTFDRHFREQGFEVVPT